MSKPQPPTSETGLGRSSEEEEEAWQALRSQGEAVRGLPPGEA